MPGAVTVGKATAGALSKRQLYLRRVRRCSRAPALSITISGPLAGWRHVEVICVTT